jgi:hypothetical protein
VNVRKRNGAIAFWATVLGLLFLAPLVVNPRLLGDTALGVGLLASLANVIGYHLWARWWESETGQHVQFVNIAITALYGYPLYRITTGVHRPPVEFTSEYWRTVIYGAIAFGMAWRFWILFRKQVWDERKRKERK